MGTGFHESFGVFTTVSVTIVDLSPSAVTWEKCSSLKPGLGQNSARNCELE